MNALIIKTQKYYQMKKKSPSHFFCINCFEKIEHKETGLLCFLSEFRGPDLDVTKHRCLTLCHKCGNEFYSILKPTPFGKNAGMWLYSPRIAGKLSIMKVFEKMLRWFQKNKRKA